MCIRVNVREWCPPAAAPCDPGSLHCGQQRLRPAARQRCDLAYGRTLIVVEATQSVGIGKCRCHGRCQSGQERVDQPLQYLQATGQVASLLWWYVGGIHLGEPLQLLAQGAHHSPAPPHRRALRTITLCRSPGCTGCLTTGDTGADGRGVGGASGWRSRARNRLISFCCRSASWRASSRSSISDCTIRWCMASISRSRWRLC